MPCKSSAKTQRQYLFELGTYSEDLPTYKDTAVAGRPIRWVVVDEEDGRALLVTLQYIDEMAFDAQGDAADFESSSLYDYLNGSFKEYAFSDAERGLIDGGVTVLGSFMVFDRAPSEDFLYATSVKGGNKVEDWWTSAVEEYSGSWLYSDIYDDGQPLANYVNTWGDIKSGDYGSEQDDVLGVRPAIWVRLN